MAKQKNKKTKKIFYWVFMLVLLIAAAVVTYLVWDNYFNDKKDETETSETSTEEKKVEEKSSEKTDEKLTSESPEKEKVVQYDGNDPNEAQGLSGAITYAAVSGANFMVRVNIDQYVTSGSCELVLKRNGTTIYNNKVNIVGSASTATCEGFDVPVSQLGGGVVEININLSADGKSGTIRGGANI